MFKLRFPSGATLELGHCMSGIYEGTLYIWPEDLDSLLEITQKEKEQNDNPMSRTAEHDRDKDS